MNENELAEFHQSIGSAVYHLQYLEDVLVSFLTMKIIYERRCAGDKFTSTDAQTLLADKRRELTLGPLIDSCMSKRIIQPQHQARVKALKRERDWLVHRSLVENGDDLYATATRDAIFSRITAIKEEAIALKKVAVLGLERWFAAHGVDMDVAQKQSEESMRNLNNQS